MPYEVIEEEGLNKIPDLKVAQWIFTLKHNPVSKRFFLILQSFNGIFVE